MLIITKPRYTTICKKPEKGLLTILDCPKAILIIFFQRSDLLSVLSIDFPRFIFLKILRIFIAKKPRPAINAITKSVFGTYCISIVLVVIN